MDEGSWWRAERANRASALPGAERRRALRRAGCGERDASGRVPVGLRAGGGAPVGPRGLAVLFSHFAPRLKIYFLRSGLADAAAEELAKETMVLVWRKAGLFDPAKAAAPTWVFARGRNLRADAPRRERLAAAPVPPGASADDSPRSQERWDPAPTAEDLAASAQREGRLRLAMRGLPREQAEVLRLSHFGDRSHAEIGRALGVPLGTVKGRLRQALARLRAALDRERP